MVVRKGTFIVRVLLTRVLLPLLAVLAIAVALDPFLQAEPEVAAVSVAVAADSVHQEEDPRVVALVQAYGALLDSVTSAEGDVVFFAGGRAVHFQDGRLLGRDELEQAEDFSSQFYPYSFEPLSEPPVLTEGLAHSTALQEILFGTTETQIRRHCTSVTFLDHRMFVNSISVESLRAVEEEIRDAAAGDPAVAAWIRELQITYSFITRDVAGSDGRSLHGWGLAVDLVPASYGGKHVYWRWSRVFNRQSWHEIPVSARWSPPQPVIEAFERHGFVWGGKWPRFDTIHFEYRPEIALHDRITSRQSPLPHRNPRRPPSE